MASPTEQHVNQLPPDWQDHQKSGPQDQYQFFLPPQSSREDKYILLDPDGKTPADYEKILSPPDQYDKKSEP